MDAKVCVSRGFSLIELVIVMVIIAIGVVTLASLFSNSAGSMTANESLQQATQYAQGCAERVMTTRRKNGFDWFASNTFSCDAATGFNVAPSISTTYTGTSTTACPTGEICRDVTITAISTANAAISAAITLLLVK